MIEVFYKVGNHLHKWLADVADPLDARRAIQDHLQDHIDNGQLKEKNISPVLALIKGSKS